MATIGNNDRLHSADYLTEFNTAAYLDIYTSFKAIPWFEGLVERILDAFRTHKDHVRGATRGLEFGGGPALMGSFVLAQFVEQIRFSDYTPSNLEHVKEWLNERPNSHDWTELFEMVMNKYRIQSGDKLASRFEWEKNLRRALQNGGFSKCADLNSVTQPCPVLDTEPKDSFDIIMSCFCLECACLTFETYKTAVKRLCAILKPGGFIVLVHGRNQSFYVLTERKFFALSINEEKVHEALLEAGFVNINIAIVDIPDDELADCDGIIVASALKAV